MFSCLYINLKTHKASLIFFWMHTHKYTRMCLPSLSPSHAHTHFNHFVSCQERNVSQPRSPLIPGVPSLIRLPLCLPSGSVLPLFLFLTLSIPLLFFSTHSFLFHAHTHTRCPSYPEWSRCCQREQDGRNARCFSVTQCFLLTALRSQQLGWCVPI